MVPPKANVVIIGAGVNGLSTAYHLALKGMKEIVVVEKEKFIAAGSTGLSAGGIRQQFSTEVNVRMAMYSVKKFERFKEEMGEDIGFHQVGYLFLLTDPEDVELFRQSYNLQRSLGLEVEWLGPDEVRKRWPYINTEDVLAATYCPTDGYADPYSVANGYAKQARRLGVQIELETEVIGIKVEGGKVKGVETTRGSIEAPIVVNTAGPYARLIGRMIGVDIPVDPYRRQVFVTDAFPDIPPDWPMTIDFKHHWYMRKEGPGLLMGMSDLTEPPSFNMNVDWSFMEKVVEHGIKRIPILEKARIMRGWAGLYEVTPDSQPIIDTIPGIEGFYCAVGFSGHGFMLSPATGLVMSELIMEGRSVTFDITEFRYNRFAEKEFVGEKHVI